MSGVTSETGQEKLRLILLSGTLFFTIGGYWLLRSIKDPVFATINGIEAIFLAKLLSVAVVTVLVFVLRKLSDTFSPHQLFSIVGGTYCVLFACIGLLLLSPTYGIYNTNGPDPMRPLGWISYCAIESFGTLGVSCFWAFANTAYDLGSAKKAYGRMVTCAQIGSIAGPTLVTQAESLGVPLLYLCGSSCVGMTVVMAWSYTRLFGTEKIPAGAAPEKPKKNKPKAGMMEGFSLVGKYSYVQGLAACSCIFTIKVTILDYAMKLLAKGTSEADNPGDPVGAINAFAAFMGIFGVCTNCLSFFFSLVGTSFVLRRFGLKTTLMLFPSLCFIAIVLAYMFPNLQMVFVVMLVLKALALALSNPCMELLYQPTSSEVKFKVKAWIDKFGQGGVKALGSVFIYQFSDSAADLLNYGMGVAIALTVCLLYISNYMGKAFNECIGSGYIVGGDDDKKEGANDNTSCGVEKEAKGKDKDC